MKNPSSNFTQRQQLKKQKGAALIVSLFLLLILTIIGVNSAQSTSLEEKMAHGILDRNVAMQSAESGIRQAETLIQNLPSLAGFTANNGLFRINNTPPDPINPTTWSSTANSFSITPPPEGSASSQYFVQEIGQIIGVEGSLNLNGPGNPAAPVNVTTFRIVARGTGGAATGAEVLLRSHFGRIF